MKYFALMKKKNGQSINLLVFVLLMENEKLNMIKKLLLIVILFWLKFLNTKSKLQMQIGCFGSICFNENDILAGIMLLNKISCDMLLR